MILFIAIVQLISPSQAVNTHSSHSLVHAVKGSESGNHFLQHPGPSGLRDPMSLCHTTTSTKRAGMGCQSIHDAFHAHSKRSALINKPAGHVLLLEA